MESEEIEVKLKIQWSLVKITEISEDGKWKCGGKTYLAASDECFYRVGIDSFKYVNIKQD
jgi:hypothetical protein